MKKSVGFHPSAVDDDDGEGDDDEHYYDDDERSEFGIFFFLFTKYVSYNFAYFKHNPF